MKELTASFIRPNDGNVYASGDLVANSVTAASVVALLFNLGESLFSIRRVRVKTVSLTVANFTFRIHLYTANPCLTAPTNGDNGAWVTKIAGYVGSFDVVAADAKAFIDGAQAEGLPTKGTDITVNLGDTQGSLLLYGLIEAKAAYVPTALDTITVSLETVKAKLAA